MDSLNRKKISVITQYATESFSERDWLTLGQLTDRLAIIQGHGRLLRALSFGDDDYESCATEVLSKVFSESESSIDAVVDHFDMDLWYEQKNPEKAQRLFSKKRVAPPQFWKPNRLKMFISHLAKNKARAAEMKAGLANWGVSAFLAHQDIEPTREWQTEIESALMTMDVLVALLEPGFRESAWTDQEVGFALGRGVEVIPLRAGLDPYGFVGKIQGVPVKGKLARAVADELGSILLRNLKYRDLMISGISAFLATSDTKQKLGRIREMEPLLSDSQLRAILEDSALNDAEKAELAAMIKRVGAFPAADVDAFGDEFPF
jgi:hypothetical protein